MTRRIPSSEPAIREAALAFLGDPAAYIVPAYSRRIGVEIDRIAATIGRERTEAIVLLPSRPDTRWWRTLEAEWICLVRGRVRFADHAAGAPFPSALQYVGPRGEAFAREFARFGPIFRQVV